MEGNFICYRAGSFCHVSPCGASSASTVPFNKGEQGPYQAEAALEAPRFPETRAGGSERPPALSSQAAPACLSKAAKRRQRRVRHSHASQANSVPNGSSHEHSRHCCRYTGFDSLGRVLCEDGGLVGVEGGLGKQGLAAKPSLGRDPRGRVRPPVGAPTGAGFTAGSPANPKPHEACGRSGGPGTLEVGGFSPQLGLDATSPTEGGTLHSNHGGRAGSPAKGSTVCSITGQRGVNRGNPTNVEGRQLFPGPDSTRAGKGRIALLELFFGQGAKYLALSLQGPQGGGPRSPSG